MKMLQAVMLYTAFGNCTYKDKTEPVSIDPLSGEFILNSIRQGGSEKNIFYFIYPSFCGACTDSVMRLIKENPLPTFRAHYVFSDGSPGDTIGFRNGTVIQMEGHRLGRYGLESAVNQVFVFKGEDCIFHSKLSAEDIPHVRRKLKQLNE